MREHREDMDEFQKEIRERDERIEELHQEYKTKIKVRSTVTNYFVLRF